jgi:hypothetical protein
VNTFPAACPLRIGKEAPQYLSIQIALALKIGIEPAVRQARTRHDLIERDILKSMAIE